MKKYKGSMLSSIIQIKKGEVGEGLLFVRIIIENGGQYVQKIVFMH